MASIGDQLARMFRPMTLIPLLLSAAAPGALAESFPGADVIVIERPANFYRMIQANNRSVCSSVLRSLNKSYGMTQEQ